MATPEQNERGIRRDGWCGCVDNCNLSARVRRGFCSEVVRCGECRGLLGRWPIGEDDRGLTVYATGLPEWTGREGYDPAPPARRSWVAREPEQPPGRAS